VHINFTYWNNIYITIPSSVSHIHTVTSVITNRCISTAPVSFNTHCITNTTKLLFLNAQCSYSMEWVSGQFLHGTSARERSFHVTVMELYAITARGRCPAVVKLGCNVPELTSWAPQHHQHAFLGHKFTKFLPELWLLAARTRWGHKFQDSKFIHLFLLNITTIEIVIIPLYFALMECCNKVQQSPILKQGPQYSDRGPKQHSFRGPQFLHFHQCCPVLYKKD